MSIEMSIIGILILAVVAYATIEIILGIKMERRAAKDDKILQVAAQTAITPSRSKLKSRKLWMALVGIAIGIIIFATTGTRYPGFVTRAGVVLVILSVLGYILSESIIDISAVEKKTYLYDDDAKKIEQLGKLIESIDEALQTEIQNRTAADAKETLARIKADNEILHAAKRKMKRSFRSGDR